MDGPVETSPKTIFLNYLSYSPASDTFTASCLNSVGWCEIKLHAIPLPARIAQFLLLEAQYECQTWPRHSEDTNIQISWKIWKTSIMSKNAISI